MNNLSILCAPSLLSVKCKFNIYSMYPRYLFQYSLFIYTTKYCVPFTDPHGYDKNFIIHHSSNEESSLAHSLPSGGFISLMNT